MKTRVERYIRGAITVGLLIGITAGVAEANEVSPGQTPIGGSFEKTEEKANELIDWIVISKKPEHVGAVPNHARTGTQSLHIEAINEPDAYQAVVREIPIDDTEKYTFTVYTMNDRRNPLKGDISGQLVIQWQDEDGREVGREWTRRWDRSLSRSRWKKYELKNLKPPKGTARGIVGVHVFEGVHGGKGAFYIDDVTLVSR